MKWADGILMLKAPPPTLPFKKSKHEAGYTERHKQ